MKLILNEKMKFIFFFFFFFFIKFFTLSSCGKTKKVDQRKHAQLMLKKEQEKILKKVEV